MHSKGCRPIGGKGNTFFTPGGTTPYQPHLRCDFATKRIFLKQRGIFKLLAVVRKGRSWGARRGEEGTGIGRCPLNPRMRLWIPSELLVIRES